MTQIDTPRDQAMADALRHFTVGQADAAARICEALCAQYPDDADALHLLGVALDARGDHARAAEMLQRAVALSDRPRFHSNLGMVLGHLNRHADALDSLARALAMRPDYPEALNNRGVSLAALDRKAEAEQAYRRALAIRPGYAEALCNLGAVLQAQGRLEEAVASCEQALESRPDDPVGLANLGTALRALGRLAASEVVLRRLVALRPADVAALNNLAITLQSQDRPHEALAVLDLAAGLDPNDAETHHHRAMILLRQGRLLEGWAIYDWRFRTRQAGDKHAQFLRQRAWNGDALEGRTILLVPEQGFGDTIQFARYARAVALRGGRVILGVQPPLARLFASLPDVAQCVVVGDALPAYDVHCPLLSLPRVFATTLETIPAQAAYLHPEPDAAARWAARLKQAGAGLRVGIVWAGNPAHPGDRERSLSLDALAPLLGVPGVRWFSLQVGGRAGDALSSSALPAGGIEDLSADLTDFAETAAVIAGLDLVISVDSAVAHLAGALGRPVWVLLPATPDWRWLRSGDTTPWYPTMRLFRQQQDRAWAPVLERVAEALRIIV